MFDKDDLRQKQVCVHLNTVSIISLTLLTGEIGTGSGRTKGQGRRKSRSTFKIERSRSKRKLWERCHNGRLGAWSVVRTYSCMSSVVSSICSLDVYYVVPLFFFVCCYL